MSKKKFMEDWIDFLTFRASPFPKYKCSLWGGGGSSLEYEISVINIQFFNVPAYGMNNYEKHSNIQLLGLG